MIGIMQKLTCMCGFFHQHIYFNVSVMASFWNIACLGKNFFCMDVFNDLSVLRCMSFAHELKPSGVGVGQKKE